MYSPRLYLSAFGWAPPEFLSPAVAALVDSVALNNELVITKHRLPLLYTTGIRWRDPDGEDDPYCDALAVYRRGYGDCDALSAIRIAEYRRDGYEAEPWIDWWIDGNLVTYHVSVLGPYGHEDPSRLLGMP